MDGDDELTKSEKLLKSIRKLLVQRNGGGVKWPRLPVLLSTYADFGDFTQSSLKAQKLMERVFWLIETDPMSLTLAEYREILKIVDIISEEYTEFMFTRFNKSALDCDGQFVEKRLTRGDLPSSWIDSYDTCFVVYIRSKFMHHYISSFVAYSIPAPAGSGSGGGGGGVAITPSLMYGQLSALSFPSVRNQYIAQTAKPISQYSAIDLIWAFEALSRAWYTMKYDSSIETYISVLTLRFSTFMSCGMSLAKDFCQGPSPEDNVTGFPAEDLHAEPDGSADMVCLPSALFRGVVSARIRAFRSVSWRISFYRSLTFRDLCVTVNHAHELMEVYNRQKRPHESAEEPLPRTRTTLESFNVGYGSRQIAELLFRYATESTTKDVSREFYSRKLAQVYLLPGDVGVFSILKQNFSKTATNIILTLKGDKYGNELLRKAKTVGMTPILRKLIERLKQVMPPTAPTQEAPPSAQTDALVFQEFNRSTATIEEEIGGLAVLDVLFKNRYSVGWCDTYFVTARNHADALLYNQERSVAGLTEESRLTDTTYKRLPVIVLFSNTFDLLYDNAIYKMPSFFDALAVWLRIVALVYDARIPIPNCKSHQYGDVLRNGLVLRSISDLCSVVTNGHSDYVIRADQKERTKVVTKKIGSTSVRIIETS